MATTIPNPNPSNFDVLKNQLFISAAEASERRSSGNLLLATLGSTWMWIKVFAILLVMALYAFVYISDLFKLFRPVNHADKANIGSVLSVEQTRKRFDATVETSILSYDVLSEYVKSKDTDDVPAAGRSDRQKLIDSVDAAFDALTSVERTRITLQITAEMTADASLDFYTLAASKLNV